ncbi:IF-2B-domain-containing protein [Auriculariales sp. MPI-PUGE-AT-0066]|nr:IF-2B-domain-containing protein [Auriculariales sp. MPI-PUGE-AT-0066]
MTKAERRELQERQRAAKTANQPNIKGPKPPHLVQPSQQQSPSSKQSQGMTHGPTPERGTRIFEHFGQPRHAGTLRSHVNNEADIHPAILKLGLQFAEFKLTGANARALATLEGLKTVIQDYSTPQDAVLNRDLIRHLTPQITYIVSARGMSVSMGNAIRQIKLHISNIPHDMPEQDNNLCSEIDNYIAEKIITADQVISSSAISKIQDGDVILTYARSSVVEKMLLQAHAERRVFSVIIVDSRPMLEGKKLLKVLSSAGISCTYCLLSALGTVLSQVSKVFVGAHSLHANGAVSSRAGTGAVATLAKAHGIPFLILCETYKYTPAAWLTQLSPLYDLTPPSSITAVVTEVGIIPPNSLAWIPLSQAQQ